MAEIFGFQGATISLEASVDLGKRDHWRVIGQLVLDAAGRGTFNDAVVQLLLGNGCVRQSWHRSCF